MIFTDAVSRTAAIGADKTAAEATGEKQQGDHLQQYRLAQSESASKSPGANAGPQHLDLSELPTSSAKPFHNDKGATTSPSMEDIKQKINEFLNHKSSAADSVKPGDSAVEPKWPSDTNFTYLSQPVYGSDDKAIAQTVEKYGSKLDYHQKQNLDDMLASTSLAETDKLKEALNNSTPETRSAYAEVMRKETGRQVTLDNRADGGYDLNVYGDAGATKIEMSQARQFAPATISSGWVNGKFDMNKWNMTTDVRTVNSAMSKLSDSAEKYRKEIGQTR